MPAHHCMIELEEVPGQYTEQQAMSGNLMQRAVYEYLQELLCTP